MMSDHACPTPYSTTGCILFIGHEKEVLSVGGCGPVGGHFGMNVGPLYGPETHI